MDFRYFIFNKHLRHIADSFCKKIFVEKFDEVFNDTLQNPCENDTDMGHISRTLDDICFKEIKSFMKQLFYNTTFSTNNDIINNISYDLTSMFFDDMDELIIDSINEFSCDYFHDKEKALLSLGIINCDGEINR